MFVCGYNKKRELPYIYGQEGRGKRVLVLL